MRAITLALTLMACADDGAPGPHDEVECESDWLANIEERCERACVVDPGRSTSPACGTCLRVVAVDGIEGCCDPEGTFSEMNFVVRWTPCDQ